MRINYLLSAVFALVIANISTMVSAASDAHPSNNMYGVGTLGIGRGDAQVTPNDDDVYFEGNGLSFGFGLGLEKPLVTGIALVGRFDVFNSLDLSSAIGSASSSYGGMVTSGLILGNLQRPNQIFLTASAGFGFSALSDQGLDEEGESICSFCTGKEGLTGTGVATRVSVGFVTSEKSRIEFVWMRVGGKSDHGNDDFSSDENAFLDSFQIQFTGYMNETGNRENSKALQQRQAM